MEIGRAARMRITVGDQQFSNHGIERPASCYLLPEPTLIGQSSLSAIWPNAQLEPKRELIGPVVIELGRLEQVLDFQRPLGLTLVLQVFADLLRRRQSSGEIE